MSFKQWLALFCFYLAYLFFGATVFYHSEYEPETIRRAEQLEERIDMHEMIINNIANDDLEKQNDIIQKLSDYCKNPITNYTLDTYEKPRTWTFFHAFHFSLVVCTTIGYGNISPTNTFGRIFMIFYALLGMPINGFVFAYLGDFFARTYYGIYRRYKAYKMATVKNYVPRRIGMIFQIILWLIPGIIFLIFVPAIAFTYFEGWPYSVSVYFAFVTLTTIGFGDYAPTYQDFQPSTFGIYYKLYEASIIFWVFIGLGYVLMIMTFIAKGLQSKRIARIEHQLSENIKFTQNRILYGVTKDVGILRRILNEVYLMKVKPVYTEFGDKTTDNKLPYSASCPDLTMYRILTPVSVRKRALSETNVKPLDSRKISSITLNRTQSETDLDRIDKKKTFEGMFASTDILAQVVSALGSLSTNRDEYEFNHRNSVMIGDSAGVGGVSSDGGGVHGFSDSQILASERNLSLWSLSPQSDNSSFAVPPKKQRQRAASDFYLAPHDHGDYNHEWTWSGDNEQIKEFIKMRTREKKIPNELLRSTIMNNNQKQDNRSVILNITDPAGAETPRTEPIVPEAINSSFLSKFNPFKKRINTNEKRNSIIGQDLQDYYKYLESSSNDRRDSRISMQKSPYIQQTDKRRQSVLSVLSLCSNGNVDVLEKTTIADLIRALEGEHKKANVPDTELMQEYFAMPKRKMGTASLTPPLKDYYERRTSFTPFHPGYTVIYNSSPSKKSKKPTTTTNLNYNNNNNQSSQNNSRRASLFKSQQPSKASASPLYTPDPSPKPVRRRFSVRPTNLLNVPGQAPAPPSATPAIQASTTLQRRLSLRPSPLARDSTPPTSSAGSLNDKSAQSNPKNLLWKSAQWQASRSRHESLTDSNEQKK